jgi:hypothetical protein
MTGSEVLDVAGGKGQVSHALRFVGIPSRILDPNPRFVVVVAGQDSMATIQTTTFLFCHLFALEGDGTTLLMQEQEESFEQKNTTTTTVQKRRLIFSNMFHDCGKASRRGHGIHSSVGQSSPGTHGSTAVLWCVMPSLFPTRLESIMDNRFELLDSCRPFALYGTHHDLVQSSQYCAIRTTASNNGRGKEAKSAIS